MILGISPPRKVLMSVLIKVAQLEGSALGRFRNWKVSQLEGSALGRFRNWKVSQLEGSATACLGSMLVWLELWAGFNGRVKTS